MSKIEKIITAALLFHFLIGMAAILYPNNPFFLYSFSFLVGTFVINYYKDTKADEKKDGTLTEKINKIGDIELLKPLTIRILRAKGKVYLSCQVFEIEIESDSIIDAYNQLFLKLSIKRDVHCMYKFHLTKYQNHRSFFIKD